MTAFNKSDTHVSTGYSVGAIDYVFKPFQPEILRAKVSAFVELSRKSRELEEEIARRNTAEREVLRLNQVLEQRVKQRTAQLETANRNLKKEIVDRKQAQKEIVRHQNSIEALNQRLKRAMTETHHRVKNNLQIAAAIVDMHLLDNKEFVSTEQVRKLGAHLQTLAAVHDLLTQEAKNEEGAQNIPARQILERLIEMLQLTLGARHIVHNIADNVRLSALQGSSLAIIANELLSNALKYSDGDIEVILTGKGKKAVLSVSDQGPGFSTGFNLVESAHTGLELVQSLIQWDLGGDVQFSNDDTIGACVTVTMPLPVTHRPRESRPAND